MLEEILTRLKLCTVFYEIFNTEKYHCSGNNALFIFYQNEKNKMPRIEDPAVSDGYTPMFNLYPSELSFCHKLGIIIFFFETPKAYFEVFI